MSAPGNLYLYLYLVVLVAPWVHLVALELIWTYRHYRWLAVFCLLLVSQSTYLLEHVTRMAQVHVLGIGPEEANGIVGVFGVQPVHLVWTSTAALLTLMLISRFPRNPWLWLTFSVIALDGLIPHASTDLQFLLSVLEVVTVNLAFAKALGRRYETWLTRVEEVRLGPGERVAHGVERVYIVTRGTGQLLRDGPGGHEILLRILAPGQIVRAQGVLVADTPLELLALPVRADGK